MGWRAVARPVILLWYALDMEGAMSINWKQVVVFGIVVAVVFFVGLGLLALFSGGYGMMGGYRGWMMGRGCPWWGGGWQRPGGWLGGAPTWVFIGWLLPLGLLAFFIVGVGHESYTDETIKQAITEGVEPDGEPLDWPMPRWSMSDEDLNDLIEFLKTLD